MIEKLSRLHAKRNPGGGEKSNRIICLLLPLHFGYLILDLKKSCKKCFVMKKGKIHCIYGAVINYQLKKVNF